MFSQYFGHYLLNNGLLTSDQLKNALELQKTTHVKFGVIAVDAGSLTSAQVEVIHEKQKQQDKRFGEIAVELGYLTNEQVDEMLSAQKKNHLFLAQAVVDQGYMTIEAFTTALNEYKKLYSLSDEKFEAIKSGDIDTIIDSLLPLNQQDKEVFSEYLSLFVKNTIRFIDDQVYVESKSLAENFQTEWVVSQEITGEKSLTTAIATDEKTFLEIASVFAEEELTEVDDLAKASVSEFLNLHNGIFLVNMSNKGTELNMKPQQVSNKTAVPGSEDTLSVTIHTSKGDIQLFLTTQPEPVAVSKEQRENQVV